MISDPGIPAEKVEDIFHPYYMIKPKGTGLGLAIVHKIITAHGGGIFIESPSGGGTRFKIVLPCGSDRGDYEKVILFAKVWIPVLHRDDEHLYENLPAA